MALLACGAMEGFVSTHHVLEQVVVRRHGDGLWMAEKEESWAGPYDGIRLSYCWWRSSDCRVRAPIVHGPLRLLSPPSKLSNVRTKTSEVRHKLCKQSSSTNFQHFEIGFT